MGTLTGQPKQVAERVIREENARRRHIVVALSGAHAYGFPSPDSDLDLKAIHVEPTRNLLGLAGPRDSFDRMEILDGVEIDYTSNELRGVLAGILGGNGNYIERILGAWILYTSPEHAELCELLPGLLSRRVHRHYRGFAASQRKAFEQAEQPTAKKLLYVLRTALTGVHLLRTGELRVDLATTAGEYGYGDARELIEAKRAGERTVLAESDRQAWLPRLDRLFELLEDARASSVLPEEPSEFEVERLERWLIEIRTRDLGSRPD